MRHFIDQFQFFWKPLPMRLAAIASLLTVAGVACSRYRDSGKLNRCSLTCVRIQAANAAPEKFQNSIISNGKRYSECIRKVH
jgi:hypothetical protein